MEEQRRRKQIRCWWWSWTEASQVWRKQLEVLTKSELGRARHTLPVRDRVSGGCFGGQIMRMQGDLALTGCCKIWACPGPKDCNWAPRAGLPLGSPQQWGDTCNETGAEENSYTLIGLWKKSAILAFRASQKGLQDSCVQFSYGQWDIMVCIQSS